MPGTSFPQQPISNAIHIAVKHMVEGTGREPKAIVMAPFFMLQYHREILPQECDLVSAVNHVNVLCMGFRIPVFTSLRGPDGKLVGEAPEFGDITVVLGERLPKEAKHG